MNKLYLIIITLLFITSIGFTAADMSLLLKDSITGRLKSAAANSDGELKIEVTNAVLETNLDTPLVVRTYGRLEDSTTFVPTEIDDTGSFKIYVDNVSLPFSYITHTHDSSAIVGIEAGQVLFGGSNGIMTGNNNFKWDYTNTKLDIGNVSVTADSVVINNSNDYAGLNIVNSLTTNGGAVINLENNKGDYIQMGISSETYVLGLDRIAHITTDRDLYIITGAPTFPAIFIEDGGIGSGDVAICTNGTISTINFTIWGDAIFGDDEGVYISDNGSYGYIRGLRADDGTTNNNLAIFADGSFEQIMCETTGYVGISKANPDTTLDIVGACSATYFVGDGSNITDINVNDSYVKNYESDTMIGTLRITLDAIVEGYLHINPDSVTNAFIHTTDGDLVVGGSYTGNSSISTVTDRYGIGLLIEPYGNPSRGFFTGCTMAIMTSTIYGYGNDFIINGVQEEDMLIVATGDSYVKATGEVGTSFC